MKKYIGYLISLSLVVTLASWGYKGHRITAMIAEDYLTPQSKKAIKAILGNETLADVSTWADEIKSQPEYRKTASWHFLNVPLGLSYKDFMIAAYKQDKENVLSAILRAEGTLSDAKTSNSDKKEALKFLVHLIGDAHQPMHISRAEDKGGNTIQVRFDGKGTNLHSLWDSKLIDHEGLSETELKQKIEANIKPTDIKAYQADKPTKWLYESYTAATKLYSDVEHDNNISDLRYESYIFLVHERLGAGGLRLAGVLNDIFKGQTVTTLNLSTAKVTNATNVMVNEIESKDAASHIGETVIIRSTAYSSKDLGSFTLVNLGAAYPNQLVTVMLKGEAKKLANGVDGKDVVVQGKLVNYKGKPEIIVTDPQQFGVISILGQSGKRGG